MTWIVVALIVIGGGVLGALWWSTQRQRPVLPSPAAPPATRAPAESLDPTDPRRTAAEQTLAQLQATATVLFGPEYLATSQVAAPWCAPQGQSRPSAAHNVATRSFSVLSAGMASWLSGRASIACSWPAGVAGRDRLPLYRLAAVTSYVFCITIACCPVGEQ